MVYHARLAFDLREVSGSIPDVSIFYFSNSNLWFRGLLHFGTCR